MSWSKIKFADRILIVLLDLLRYYAFVFLYLVLTAARNERLDEAFEIGALSVRRITGPGNISSFWLELMRWTGTGPWNLYNPCSLIDSLAIVLMLFLAFYLSRTLSFFHSFIFFQFPSNQYNRHIDI